MKLYTTVKFESTDTILAVFHDVFEILRAVRADNASFFIVVEDINTGYFDVTKYESYTLVMDAYTELVADRLDIKL